MDFMPYLCIYLCCDWDLVHVSYTFYHWMYPDSYFKILRQSLAKLPRLVLNPRLPPPHPPPKPRLANPGLIWLSAVLQAQFPDIQQCPRYTYGCFYGTAPYKLRRPNTCTFMARC